MKKIFFLIPGFLLIISITTVGQADTSGSAIAGKKFSRLAGQKKTIVLDVRTPEKYKEGFIGDALNYNVLDSTHFIQQRSRLNKRKKYLLYCKSGRRSGKALLLMKDSGFRKVYHLKGGITEWTANKDKPE